MRKLVYLGVALLFISGTLGCALLQSLLGGFHKPELTFDRAVLREVSLTGLTVDLHWKLKNDNPLDLDLASLAYSFAVENHTLVAGKPSNGLHVKASGSTDLTFPAHVEFKDLAANLQVFLKQDVAHYSASGSVGVKTPVGVVTLPLSKSGTFPVPKVPQVALQAPKLDRIDLGGAHITLPVRVHNTNGFALPFTGLLGKVSIAGAQVASTNVGQMAALAPNEARIVNLGVDVSFLQSGLAVANAIRSKSVDVGYHGNLDVAGMAVPLNFSQRMNLR